MRDERENNATHESLRMICPCHVRLPPRWLLNAKAPTRTGDCSFALYCDSLDIHLIFNNQLCEGQSLFVSRKAMERGRDTLRDIALMITANIFARPLRSRP